MCSLLGLQRRCSQKVQRKGLHRGGGHVAMLPTIPSPLPKRWPFIPASEVSGLFHIVSDERRSKGTPRLLKRTVSVIVHLVISIKTLHAALPPPVGRSSGRSVHDAFGWLEWWLYVVAVRLRNVDSIDLIGV